MAHHKSAKKRAITSVRRRDRNKSYLSSVRKAVKNFRVAAESKASGEEIEKLFVHAQSMLSRAAAKGILHSNNASRKVARLSALKKKLAN
ncbi:MAG: 30S ribosomal protein S20 [Pseudobacteriovorax sp.]|nr:30S ribosomal protein S20 [Pseudobacteriovorax sp.]